MLDKKDKSEKGKRRNQNKKLSGLSQFVHFFKGRANTTEL